MKHGDREGEQCQTLGIIEMEAVLCFQGLRQKTQPLLTPGISFDGGPGEDLGLGTSWMPATLFKTHSSSLYSPSLADPQSASLL